MSARARLVVALLCAATSGCNLLLGLDAGSERGGGGAGGSGTGAGASGGGGSGGEAGAEPEGGGGTISTGGGDEGGAGGAGCAPEENAGPGREIVANGSFESGVSSWIPSSLPALTIVDGFCGCQAAEIELPGNYGELRNASFTVLPAGTTVRARARLRAPDSVAAALNVRGSNNDLEPPAQFMNDADDTEGSDGWRLAEITWTVPPFELEQTIAYIAVDGGAGQLVALDCISVTVEP